jgi:AbrB family looped-hinge helix DNA binding protein
MNYTTTLTQNGQMTLPKRIRDLLGAESGTRLSIGWENGRAVVGIQDNNKRLQVARDDSISHLKKVGLFGLSEEEIATKIAKRKIEYYGKKYGIS